MNRGLVLDANDAECGRWHACAGSCCFMPQRKGSGYVRSICGGEVSMYLHKNCFLTSYIELTVI